LGASDRFRPDVILNLFIKSISGTLAQGDRLSVYIAPPGKAGMRFKPTVLTVRPERELRWLGHLLIPGVFYGEHYFSLEPIGVPTTRLVQGEKFSGLLVGLLSGTLSATEAGFNLSGRYGGGKNVGAHRAVSGAATKWSAHNAV
jgi:hypothetical protein